MVAGFPQKYQVGHCITSSETGILTQYFITQQKKINIKVVGAGA